MDDEKKIAFDVMTVPCKRFEYVYTLARIIIPYFLLFVLSAIFLLYFQFSVFYTNNARAVFYISIKYIGHSYFLSFKRDILIDSFVIMII